MPKLLTRLPIRLVFLAVWLVILAFGGMAQGKLSSVQENDSASFLSADAESTRAAAAAQEFLEADTIPVLVTGASDQELTKEEIGQFQEFAQTLFDTEITDPTTGDKVTIGELSEAEKAAAIPSEDLKAILIPLDVPEKVADARGEGTSGIGTVVDALRSAIKDADVPAGMELHVAGPGGYIADLVGAFGGVDLLLLLVALGVVAVILLIVYRSPILPIAVLATDLFALCGAALLVYQLAANEILTLDGQSQGIMSILVIGATTDYSLLLVSRYREALSEHALPRDAMVAALKGATPAIVASGATVIVGLLALLLSGLSATRSLGPIATIGIVAALLAALTLLPALLLLLGKRSRGFFWPSIPRADSEHLERHRLWSAVARFVARRDRLVWIGTALLLIASSALAPTFKANGTSDSDILIGGSDAVSGNQVLEDHFPAGAVQPVQVIVTEDEASSVADAIADLDGVEDVKPYADMPEGMPPGAGGQGEQGPPPDAEGAPTGAEGAPADAEGAPADAEGTPSEEQAPPEPKVVDGKVMLEVATEHLPDDPRSWDVVTNVRSVAHEADSDALVGGAAAEKLDTRDTARADIWRVVPITLLGIFIMLIILLRSLAAPLMLIVANCLSFLATMGLAALAFNHLLDLPGADPSVPLYGFVFLVALGIDYTIFLMTRVREESMHHPTKEALRKALATTGGVITSAGLVLAATFAVLSVIPLLFMLQLAVIVALGVLIDTFIVRTLLVGGFTHDVGEWIWWPAKRRHNSDGDVADKEREIA